MMRKRLLVFRCKTRDKKLGNDFFQKRSRFHYSLFTIHLFALLLLTQKGFSQQNIDSFEYAFDGIGAYGQAVNKLAITPQQNNVSNFFFTPNISSLSNGFHVMYARTHSTTGLWSITNYTFFYKQSIVTPAVSTIQKLEYFIDVDPGAGNAIPISVTPATEINGTSFSPNIGALSTGFHVLFIRSLNANGKWSITNYTYFYKQSTLTPIVSTIQRLEYFFDTDPGMGSGKPVVITPATNISGLNFNADVSSIVAGPHVLFIRSLDADGKWSITNYSYFFKAGPQAATPVDIVKIEFFIDTDPGIALATNIPVTPAADIANQNFSASITGLAPGLHYMNLRSLDSRGNWSLVAYDTFRIASTLPLRLLNFDAVAQGSSVRTQWQTGFEQNLSQFDVEHSVNGRMFIKIGSVQPQNNLSGTAYSFSHTNPVKGNNFYRLKTIENDGSIHYSNIKLVWFGEGLISKLYPNPADKEVNILYTGGLSVNAVITVYNVGGQVVKQVKIQNASKLIDVSSLASGWYTVCIVDGGKAFTQKLVVKH